MSQSQIKAAQFPLPAGTHWICTCGQSKNFPHCDGAHQGSDKQPVQLVLETAKVVEIDL